MPGIALVGAQWGDEGKGKVTDIVAEHADVVVRFQGGANAGHTIAHGGEVYKLHLVPSGIFHPHVTAVIGAGVVLEAAKLLDELDELRRRGIDTSALRVSANAHLIMPYHVLADKAGELALGKQKLGTTGRGIGPCYADKALRLGIRVQDLLDEKILKQKLLAALGPKRAALHGYDKHPALDLHQIVEAQLACGRRLERYIADTSPLLWDAFERGELVVFEGAQAAMLDIDHGTYPFVTSSSTLAGAACAGAGVGPTQIDEVWGVSKAYTTRVGAGPFPTECHDELGVALRDAGHEYGTTTGRPRRCGWLDLVALRYAARLNGMTGLAVTKLDVLRGFHPLRLATSYLTPDGARFESFPYHQSIVHKVIPQYVELDGWDEDISAARTLKELPSAAREFLAYVERFVRVPLAMVSVGPEREQTIICGALPRRTAPAAR